MFTYLLHAKNMLTAILYNNTRILCACVCLCVCLSNLRYPEWEVVSPRHLHHLEELCLANCITCFSSLYDTRLEKKAFGSFSPVTRQIPYTHGYFPVTLGRMNLATTRKPLEHSQRVCVEGHALHITGTIIAIDFYVNLVLLIINSTKS